MTVRRTPAIVAAIALAVPGAAVASQQQFSIFEAPQEMANDALRAQTFDEVADLGVKHMRVLVYWNDVAPANESATPPNGFDAADPDDPGYNWGRYDSIFAEAERRGIEIIPTLTGPVPRWATANRKGHLFKPDRTMFAQFAEAVGRRYGDRVGTWTVWNEPNQPTFLAPQRENGKAYSPYLYRALYQGALQGLNASGNGGDRILAGETAPFGGSAIVPPITFARLFFKGRKLDVDGWAHHPYSTAQGPFYTPPSTAVTIGVLPRLLKALDRYAPGKEKLPVFLTEFGVQSKPDPIFGVSQQQQAEFRAISERIAYNTPRVRAISQYLMRDDQPREGSDKYGGFESGLRLADGTAKLSYDGFRMPLTATRRGGEVRLWGLIRPARGRENVTLMQRDGGEWKVLRRVITTKRGSFTATATYKKGREFRSGWNTNASPATSIYRAP